MAIDTQNRQPAKVSTIGRYYAPRAMLRLDIPIDGALPGDLGNGGISAEPGIDGSDASTTNIITIWCPVLRVELCSNNHLEADTLTASVDWRYAGVGPRVLSAAIVTLYLGQDDPGSGTEWIPADADIRFIGVMKRSKRQGGEEQGLTVEILAYDYTTFFLEAKKFPANGMPLFSETLSQAWNRICTYTGVIDPEDTSNILPTVKYLTNRIRFVGEAKDVLLGSVAPSRFQTLGRVNAKMNSDAWAVWQETVGMLGLISYIRLDECIVTTATDYYTESDPPVFLWGDNIESIIEDRDTTLCGKGICLQSFDPMTGTQIESYYPLPGDRTLLRHKIAAKKKNSQAAQIDASDFEYYAYPGVSSQTALDAVCKNIYVQRASQELEGRIVTAELIAYGANSISDDDLNPSVRTDAFNLLTLQAGDSIQVRIDQDTTEALGQIGGDQAKVDYLVGIGYSESLAQVWVANMRGVLDLTPIYLVKRVQTTLDSTGDHPKFSIEISYCSKLLPDGNATGRPTDTTNRTASPSSDDSGDT